MAQSHAQDELVSGINVTPLVDVTLVLLIIFMVTAKLIAQRGVPTDLPKAATAGEVQTVFAVSIDQDGKRFIEGQSADSDSELRRLAAQALAMHPDLRTVIEASGAARHAAVLHVMDELREAGITKIAFAADPVAEPTPAP
jgi:biopolymer transport protein ExbD